MPNSTPEALTPEEIVAAVSAGRLSAQEAHAMLTGTVQSNQARPHVPHHGAGTVVARREWQRLELPAAHDAPTLALVVPGTMTLQQVRGQLPTTWLVVEYADDVQLVGRERILLVVSTDDTGEGPDSHALFTLTQRMLRERVTGVSLEVWVLRADQRALAWAQASSAFLRTAAAENPQVRGAVALCGDGANALSTLAALSPAPAGGDVVELRGAQAHRLALAPVSALAGPASPAGWAFLITGGTGGLAWRLGQGLLDGGATRVVLVGRRDAEDLPPEVAGLLQREPARARYRRVDLADRQAVARVLAEAREGSPLTVLHAAGVRHDAFLLKQTQDRLYDAVRAKAGALETLLACSRPGDEIVAFSSVSASTGNPGQSVYAFANGYLDGRALGQASLRSIGWPLWADGGMQIVEGMAETMRTTTGMAPLGTSAGLELLLRLVNDDACASVVAVGDEGRIMATLGLGAEPTDADPRRQGAAAQPLAPGTEPRREASSTEPDGDLPELHARTCRLLVGYISDVTEVPPADIHHDEPFDQFGLDSIVAMRIGEELGRHFADLPKTLLFEHQNIDDLARYFVVEHTAVVRSLVGMDLPPVVAPAPAAPTTTPLPAGQAPSTPAQPAHAATEPSARRLQRPEADNRIAIIGLAGRYPGAGDIRAFWSNLVDGVDSISEIPEDRWDRDQFFSPTKGEIGRTNSRWGGFLDGIDQFDPRLFHINAREASIMDPQERLFLETVWTAVEDAGYRARELRGQRVAVFAGAMYTEYQMLPSSADGRIVAHSSLHASIANRVSYYLDLTGPSVALDTMCSSSLVAIHYACRSILDGEATMAIAGGVNLSLTPEKYLFLSQGNFLSSDGRCRAFGAGGDGYVPSEGVGAVILKPLADAERDGDHVYGVILGSAVNHDGKTSGYTVPNPKAQADVIERALAAGDVDPAEVSYIEAHGTGTELGDPIELKGLQQIYAGCGPRRIGSVKSNIGHAESSAGIASLTKVLLQMKHGELVPSLHAGTLNPALDLGDEFVVQRELEPWSTAGHRRVAGISCFGAGGANCHMVIAEYPQRSRRPSGRRVLVPFSAPSEEQLRRLVANMVSFLESAEGAAVDVTDLAATLLSGRERFRSSLTAVADGVPALVDRLRGFLSGDRHQDVLFRSDLLPDEDLDYFLGGEEGRAALQRLVAGHDVDQLARLWSRGVEVDAAALYGAYRRVSLPTYVFEHARYWIPQEQHQAASRLTDLLDTNESDLDGVRYRTTVAAHGPKASLVAGDRVAAAAGPLLAVDAVTALQGVPPRCAMSVRWFTQERYDLPSSLDVRCGRATAGIVAETIGPDGLLGFQATFLAQPQGAVVALPEDLCERLRGERRPAPDGAEAPFTTPDGAEGVVLARPLGNGPGSLLVAAHRLAQGGQAGLVESLRAESLGEQDADVAVVSRTSRRTGSDVEFYSLVTGELVGRVVGLRLAGDGQAATGGQAAVLAASEPAPVVAESSDDVQGFIVDICTDLFGIGADRFDVCVPFEEYGMDSVLVGRFTERVRARFPELPEMAFFEHTTAARLIAHLEGLSPQQAAEPAPAPQRPTATPTAPVGTSRPIAPARIGTLLDAGGHAASDAIAIVGMGGVFPEAADLTAYWENLLTGRESVTLIPRDRWDYRPYFDPETQIPAPGTVYSPWGAFVSDPFGFDHRFFSMTPADALVIDPQERMLLETVWHTLEDAGRPAASLTIDHDEDPAEDVGVFVATTSQTYHFWGAQEHAAGNPLLTSASPWSLANRISYFFNFSGPSLPVDTACSSSLTALHMAVDALHAGDCTSAVVAGVNLILHPLKYFSMCQMKMLSPTGTLSAFGAKADGFVPGEGVAALLLKPLSAAIADGDRIRAVIRSAAVNHGGKTNGYTVPSVTAQSRLLSRAWRRAGIDPSTIGYLEMHGTGTRLGDPIEVEAARRARQSGTERDNACWIGSVKANIGHLESCSGLASLVKVVRQMETATVTPSVNAWPLNPRLELDGGPFRLAEVATPWEVDELSGVLRAGISSFGAGGANAHVVLESYPSAPSALTEEAPQLLVLSARDADHLPMMADALAGHLSAHPEIPLADVAWTLQHGREELDWRAAVVAQGCDEAIHGLRALAAGESAANVVRGEEPATRRHDGLVRRADLPLAELRALGRAWVEGHGVEWDGLHAAERRIVSLPGYPFAHTWFVAPHREITPLPPEQAADVEAQVRHLREDARVDGELAKVCVSGSCYLPQWERTDVGTGGDWSRRVALLVAVDETGAVPDRMDESLRDAGAQVRRVTLTQTAAMTPAATAAWAGVTDVVLLPQPARDDADPLWDAGVLTEELEQRLVQTLALLKLVLTRGERCEVHVVTDRVHPIGDGPTRPWGAGVADLVRGAAAESDLITGVAIDACLGDAEGQRAACRVLLGAPATREVDQLRVRDGVVERRVLAPTAVVPRAASTIQGSVHVIVGGLGSVGFAYAKHLVHGAKARVCLVGRSSLTPARRRMLDELGTAGIHYLYRQADATDPAAMANLMADVQQKWGRIDSLVHSAMTFDESRVVDMTRESLLSVVQSKSRALQAMLLAARRCQVGDVLVFSSSQAYLGTRGRAHYGAACASIQAFLDAAAPQLDAAVHRIDWGFWGVDKGRRIDATFEKFLTDRGIRPIGEAEGMALIDAVLAGDLREVTVMTVSERVRQKVSILATTPAASSPPPGRAERITGAGVAEHRSAPPPCLPDTGTTQIDLLAVLTGCLADTIAAAPAEIDPQQSFMDMGLDSISGMKFVQAVRETLGIKLADTSVFDYPTLQSLAELVQHELGPVAVKARQRDTGDVQSGPIVRNDPVVPSQPVNQHDDVLAMFKRLENREISPEQAVDELRTNSGI